MSLIICPECKREISDQSDACIHCGMPLKKIKKHTDFQLYKIIFKKFYNHSMYSKNRFKAFGFVEKIYNNYEPQAKYINLNREYTIFNGISKYSAELVNKYLKPLGCIIEILDSDLEELSPIDEKIISIYEDGIILKCPRCGSTAITTGQRGFNIVTGFLGSNKTVNRCGKCGYSWQPK